MVVRFDWIRGRGAWYNIFTFFSVVRYHKKTTATASEIEHIITFRWQHTALQKSSKNMKSHICFEVQHQFWLEIKNPTWLHKTFLRSLFVDQTSKLANATLLVWPNTFLLNDNNTYYFLWGFILVSESWYLISCSAKCANFYHGGGHLSVILS